MQNQQILSNLVFIVANQPWVKMLTGRFLNPETLVSFAVDLHKSPLYKYIYKYQNVCRILSENKLEKKTDSACVDTQHIIRGQKSGEILKTVSKNNFPNVDSVSVERAVLPTDTWHLQPVSLQVSASDSFLCLPSWMTCSCWTGDEYSACFAW